MELKFDDLRMSYGTKQALKGISMTLNPGIYGLLGPNGAGKSTAMNIITGNLRQTGGTVLYDGQDIRTLGKEFRARVGYCPQQQTLYPNFTAEQFLYYIASLHGMKKQAAGERIDWALKLLVLDDVRRKPIRSFSGGMKQRLMIAQSILHDPDILILDEPTAGLDPKQRIAVRNLIGQIALHKIVIISTHVVSDVEYIAKELLLLSEGKLLRQSAPKELLHDLHQRVWEVTVEESQIPTARNLGKISGIAKEEDAVCLRLISDTKPDLPCRSVRPALEDVYLHYFGESEGL